MEQKDGSEAYGIIKAFLIPRGNISPYLQHNFGSPENPSRIATNCRACGKLKKTSYCLTINLHETMIDDLPKPKFP